MNKTHYTGALRVSLTALGSGVSGLVALAFSTTASAALLGRLPATPGGTDYQAYYDTTLDLTWIADANLAASNTFGLAYDTDLGVHPDDLYPGTYFNTILSDGRMTWGGALHWIDAMNTSNGGAGYLGFGGWRLPMMLDTGAAGCDYAISGTDCGFNVQTGSAATVVYSELASLWYDTLGNIPLVDTAGNGPQAGWGQSNTGPFSNLQANYYWSGLEYVTDFSNAWYFRTYYGLQHHFNKSEFLYGLAVRSGDVSVVPVPAAAWLFGSGLIGLLGMVKRRR